MINEESLLYTTLSLFAEIGGKFFIIFHISSYLERNMSYTRISGGCEPKIPVGTIFGIIPLLV